jgi:hypothetical protein
MDTFKKLRPVFIAAGVATLTVAVPAGAQSGSNTFKPEIVEAYGCGFKPENLDNTINSIAYFTKDIDVLGTKYKAGDAVYRVGKFEVKVRDDVPSALHIYDYDTLTKDQRLSDFKLNYQGAVSVVTSSADLKRACADFQRSKGINPNPS